MLTSVLVIVGGTFGVTVVGGTIAAVVKKIKNKKTTNKTAPTLPEPTPKPQRTLTVEKVRKTLQDRIAAVEKDSARIDAVIAKKLDSVKIDPDTKEHRELLEKAIKSRWNSVSQKYIAKVQNSIETLNNKSDLQAVLDTNKPFVGVESFVDKCEKSVLANVSEKYRFYENERKKISLDNVDLSNKKNRTAKIIASKDMIDSLFDETINMIINDTKVDDFKVNATTNFRTIKNEVENINEFMKIKRALELSLSSVAKLDKSKASKEDVDKKINELAKVVGQYKEKVDLIDLKAINDSLDKLEKDFKGLDASLDAKLKKFKSNVAIMTNRKINEVIKNTVSRTDLNVFMAEVRGILDGFKHRLNSNDLSSLYLKLDELTKSYEEVNGRIDESVKKEVEAMKKNIMSSVTKKINAAVKGKVDRAELDTYKEEISQIVSGFKEHLTSLDLASLSVKLEELTKAYQEVYGRIDVSIKKEIEEMKISLNKSISVRIGIQLKKKLVGFDDKQIQKVIDKAVEEAKKIVPDAVDDKLNEEEFVDRVIDVLNNRITIKKK